jgi:hypothetical protein
VAVSYSYLTSPSSGSVTWIPVTEDINKAAASSTVTDVPAVTVPTAYTSMLATDAEYQAAQSGTLAPNTLYLYWAPNGSTSTTNSDGSVTTTYQYQIAGFLTTTAGTDVNGNPLTTDGNPWNGIAAGTAGSNLLIQAQMINFNDAANDANTSTVTMTDGTATTPKTIGITNINTMWYNGYIRSADMLGNTNIQTNAQVNTKTGTPPALDPTTANTVNGPLTAYNSATSPAVPVPAATVANNSILLPASVFTDAPGAAPAAANYGISLGTSAEPTTPTPGNSVTLNTNEVPFPNAPAVTVTNPGPPVTTSTVNQLSQADALGATSVISNYGGAITSVLVQADPNNWMIINFCTDDIVSGTTPPSSAINKWWYNPNDGYFYWMGVLTSGASTTPLIDSVTYSAAADGSYAGMDYTLNVLSDGTQAVQGAIPSWLSAVVIGNATPNPALVTAYNGFVPASAS